ncbi:MAG: VCBS repeat-containing protein [Robiginitalea sp.]
MKRIFEISVVLVLMASCQQEPAPGFRELEPGETGVHFKNQLLETPELNILNYLYYYNGAGVLAADFNNDSLPDLYFGANQQPDVLYINKGGMKFVEAGEQSGISTSDGWTTGVTHADINGDGLEDIYVCKASGYRALEGRNFLYINQGFDNNGIPHFKEAAREYGLDFSGLSTQAAFFDYDLDGDLDLFLLNHSVHPNRNYGKGAQRKTYDPLSGDRLYRNEQGYFTDVSQEAGIFQGKAGYGLGLGISDLNNDGYPDIYVGNDFFENDYLYLNRGDGTFEEIISSGSAGVGHTTHYSMGNDLADINNDGLMDLVSLDMLPEDLLTYKTSGLEYAYPIYRQYLRNGFAPQYMQNTLQLNLGNASFSEVAYLSGIAATEWSWGALLADFDNDGHKDLFVSNGIKGATNDMDYMNFIANEDIQRRIDQGMQDTDMPMTREIPPKKVPNYIFRNNGDLTFTDMSGSWIGDRPTYSHGSTYADLDGDGDLDLVVNHVDETASILENTLEGGNFLNVSLSGDGPNTRGIGGKVIAYSKEGMQVVENYTTRGYLSSIPSGIHLGLGNSERLDSLLVIWPGGNYQKVTDVRAGQHLVFRQVAAKGNYYGDRPTKALPLWRKTDSLLLFVHRENPSLDFDREPLIAYARSNQGPAISTADIDNDGLEDLFISGGKRQASVLFVQQPDGSFVSQGESLFETDAINEDTAHRFLDVDSDGWQDLVVVSGGNEFNTGNPIRPRLYRNRNGTFEKDTIAFKDCYLNASAVDTLDMDRDGDLDLLISADAVPGAFGKSPAHKLFENDGQGHFREVTEEKIPEIQEVGGISDFKWADLNGDGLQDLVAAGHWTPVAVFINTGDGWQQARKNGLEYTDGWWNCLEVADIDRDGDLDIIGGNWGLNSKFQASRTTPVNLYRADFDQNGSVEPLVTYYHKGVETPFASKDELGKQMPFLNKKYRTYAEFAKAPLESLFGTDALREADRKQVYELGSFVFLNDGSGHFESLPLPGIAQASTIYDFLLEDLDQDGLQDLMITGNLYEVSTQLGRMDAFHGLVLKNEGRGTFSWAPELAPPVSGAGRKIDTLRISDKKHYIIGRNNASPLIFTKDNF